MLLLQVLRLVVVLLPLLLPRLPRDWVALMLLFNSMLEQSLHHPRLEMRPLLLPATSLLLLHLPVLEEEKAEETNGAYYLSNKFGISRV